MDQSRRQLIKRALFGSGAVGLRALATGIPAHILLDPLRAQAQDKPRALILVSSSSADPIGANVPGTYRGDIAHPASPTMAATKMTLGERTVTAAKPWADLPKSMRDRMCFIHHTTLTNTHPNHPKVMRLMGGTRGGKMAPSIYANELGQGLGTVQTEPLSLGANNGRELFEFDGRMLANIAPTQLSQILAGTGGELGELAALRDRELDRLHTLLKEHGTSNQRKLIDRFAKTRGEIRSLSGNLLDRLSAIKTNNGDGQAQAIPVLLALNVSPVLSMRIPFGGDNHADADLAREAAQTVSGVSTLRKLVEGIDKGKADGEIAHDVVIATMNVFGRTLSKKGRAGRDHNPNRHCTILIGDAIKPGVVGSLKPQGNDWTATSIDSKSGAGGDGKDIAFVDTLNAVGKTVGAALGVSRDVLDYEIRSGKVIEAALR